MESLINIGQKFVLIKDMSSLVNFDIINEEYEKAEFVNNVGNLISADKKFLDKPYLQGAKEFFTTECERYLTASFPIKEMFTGLKITDSWANKTLPNDGHHEHTHPFSVVSGVLFLDDNPDNLNFYIEGYTPDIPFFVTKSRSYVPLSVLLQDLNVNLSECNNLKNHLLMFLSNSYHFVKPISENSKERRTISFNTFWRGKTGFLNDTMGSYDFN